MKAFNSPLRIAVIGAGPAGIYTAESLVKERDDVLVDIIDRLPAPFGLVRYGVAPDHQKMKSVTRMFHRTCSDPRVRFLGNVQYGRDLNHEDLQLHYHATVYAVGSPTGRRLGIPGEDLPGNLSATEFVGWYNGHPHYQDLDVPLSGERAVVIGVGNVAIDVTRILAKSVEELAQTDITDAALAALRRSNIREITIVGRRGPAQARFTTKELRELGELENADIDVLPRDLQLDAASRASLEDEPMLRRNVEVIEGFREIPATGKPRRVRLRFFLSPVEIIGSDRVEAIRLERNELLAGEDGRLSARGTGEIEEWPVDLVLRSVGYQGEAVDGVPFDERRRVIPNERGQVVTPDSEPVTGEFVAGWIKRGPSGVIGTNKADAMETVRTLLSARLREPARPSPEAVDSLLESRGVRAVSYDEWCRLDELEVRLGEPQGRPRVKFTRLEEMLERLQPVEQEE